MGKTKNLEDLPYRPCVGVALFNQDGHVWIGRRIDAPHPDSEGSGAWWQMPQGGIDEGEDPLEAAYRELYEETSVTSVSVLGRAPELVRYELPEEFARRAWKGKYRGQEQHWFAFRFEGDEREIDVRHPGGGGHEAEFSTWRWEPLENTVDLVVDFKRPVYEAVVEAFRPLTKKD